MSSKEVRFSYKDDSYTVPASWSYNASYIFIDKYCRSYRDYFKETSVRDVFHRLVNLWFHKEGVDYVRHKSIVFNDMYTQKVSPNSPQFFNGGLYHSYKVKGGNIGLWYKSPVDKKIKKSSTTFEYPQLHACFIQPITDSIEGILELLENEARLFSRGSGTGTNFSNLRATNETLAGGGTTSGLISFLKIFDTMAGAIKSGGTTRRAAKMVVIDDDHPDLIEFINWKRVEEEKAQDLIKTGKYSNDWQGEAYQTVSGQNSNNSIRITDQFMYSVENDDTWLLKGRVDSSVNKLVKARIIWNAICASAWHCADPGLQFTGAINHWNTTPKGGEIYASNPCSEHLRLDNSSCNLASINLCALLDDNGNFDCHEYVELIDRWVDILDRSIDIAGYPSKKIATTTHNYRDIGLGYCGLGALLMRLGLPYDSDSGRFLAALLTAVLNSTAYYRSALLAKEKGSYPKYKENRFDHMNVLSMHHEYLGQLESQSYGNIQTNLFENLFELAKNQYENASDIGEDYGFRNAQMTVIAPTGTIGLIMDCETTGIEPVFALETYKSLAGGGHLKTESESYKIAKAKGYDSPNLFQTAIGENSLSPTAHIEMVAAVQKHISGGISKTVNLPADTTVEDIDKIYTIAWKKGLKCISVYRDGSKSQPLESNECKTCGDDEACEIENH